MSMIWQAADEIEPIAADTIAAIANIANYNVVSGCAQTYSAANMTKTVAAGVVTHNGSSVTVAGNNVTLVSDPALPRFTTTAVNSSGTAVIISGDPAADPAVPELGDNVMIGLDKIQAGQTIADNIVTQLDKRVISPPLAPIRLVASNTTEQTATAAANTSLVTLTPATPIPVTALCLLVVRGRKSAGAAANATLGLTVNATAVWNATAQPLGSFSSTDRAEDGMFYAFIAPGITNYLNSTVGTFEGWVSASHAATGVSLLPFSGGTAPLPAAAITSITITGYSGSTSVTVAVKECWLFQLGS
jgi:flagella basal body P-ring formation protein FlgA